MRKTSLLTLTLVGLFLLLAPFVGTHSSSATWDETQAGVRNRVVDKSPWGAEPIRVVGLQVNGQAISFSRPFSGDDNWMQGFSFNVKNISNKNITHMRFELLFPLTEGPPRPHYFAAVMEYGKELPGDGKAVKLLKPGDTAHLTFNPVDAASLKTAIRKYTKAGALLNYTARLSTEAVHFDDDTMWGAGELFRRNKSTDRWEQVGSAFAERDSLERHMQIGYFPVGNLMKPQTMCGGYPGKAPECVKALPDKYRCECHKVDKSIFVPGEEVCTGNSEADKSVSCPEVLGVCIGDTYFYTGVAPGCRTL